LNIRAFTIFIIAYTGVGSGAYLGLMAWAAAAGDAGAVAGVWLVAVGVLVRYVLLQPMAYWVIDATGLAWWTWSGLAALVLVCAANSVLIAALLWRLLGMKSGSSRAKPR